MWWEYAVVGVLLLVAGAVAARRLLRSLRGQNACECGRSASCPMTDADGTVPFTEVQSPEPVATPESTPLGR